MACEVCSTSINIFTRKKCSECKRQHCSKCAWRTSTSTSSTSLPKICVRCYRLVSMKYTRQDLNQYTVKELRQFLIRRNHNMDYCTEKADLVEAAMKLNSIHHQTPDDVEHLQHVEQLKERMLRENFNSGPQTSDTPHQSSESELPPPRYSGVDENIPSPPDSDVSSSGALPTQMEMSSDASSATSTTLPSVLPEQEAVPSVSMQMPAAELVVDATTTRRMTLNQLAKEEDIEGLSVRQLKELLVTNYVDYKGCCERQELMDRVRRLWMDNNKNKGLVTDSRSNSDADLCKVCMDAVIDCILLECGHMVTCTQCGKRMAECPICRHYVSRVVHVFKA